MHKIPRGGEGRKGGTVQKGRKREGKGAKAIVSILYNTIGRETSATILLTFRDSFSNCVRSLHLNY